MTRAQLPLLSVTARKIDKLKTVRILTSLAALIAAGISAHAAVRFTTLHSFQIIAAHGTHPTAALTLGSDGNFYGTTGEGGAKNNGTVFKISTNGTLTTLYSFGTITDANGDPLDGANPDAALAQGSDGNFYGITSAGGTNDAGTVFCISPAGALTNLYSFTGADDGWEPSALVQGSDGNFYGTTMEGGADGGGTVFRISTSGVLTSLYAFTGGNGPSYDGGYPNGLTQGSDGFLYGTTVEGGEAGQGTVFQISTNGTLTSLCSFTGGNGISPTGLVQGRDGYFYGTTVQGGGANYGTIFRIDTHGALATLYSFGRNNGFFPEELLVQGSDGNFYGVTDGSTNGAGTVFEMTTNGALSSLYSFTGGNDGSIPNGLALGSDGNLYGTTVNGGTANCGTVFEITANGALTTLYSFTSSNDGSNPNELVLGSDGNFYGTTSDGGTNGGYYGTVFQMRKNGALRTLYAFNTITSRSGVALDGAGPGAGLVEGSDGYFYGTTAEGGTNGMAYGGFGTVFRISTNGTLTTLYCFTGANDGHYPWATLVQGSDGSFYGTTLYGGTAEFFFLGMAEGYGTVFKISTNGVYSHLWSFTGGEDGAYPYAGLVQGSDGCFYGTTFSGGMNGYGAVFKIDTDGAYSVVYSFMGGDDGGNPYAGLVQGSDGYFYGTTYYGGTNGYGTVFKISTNGALTSLYSCFTPGNDSTVGPNSLVQGSDGNFYGTTAYGNGNGTIFQLGTNGTLTTLYAFSGGNDGANPGAGLVQGCDGSFYGTTASGGVDGTGTIFRLTVVPSPQLAIIKSANSLKVSWPYKPLSNWTLQQNSDLSATNWTATPTGGISTDGTNNFITITPSAGSLFFRLSQQ